MRKLSEILKIGLKYYDPQDIDGDRFMCLAIAEAYADEALSSPERQAGGHFCESVVKALCPGNTSLHGALCSVLLPNYWDASADEWHAWESRCSEYQVQIWHACIDKLASEGK